jgi:hypothetical protein
VRPSTREGIEDCRGQLLGVQADLARLSVDVELPVEADEEALVLVKTLIERARGNY